MRNKFMRTAGILLILLVLGLFALWLRWTRRQKGTLAMETGGAQEFNIAVKGAYSPAVIRAQAGRPVRINFKREESTECSRFVIFGDFKIKKALPEGEVVPIEFTPQKKGEYLFTCDMGMYQGRLVVE